MPEAQKELEGRVVKAMPATAGIETDQNASLMYGNLDFITVPGSKPSKYAVNLAKLMFTKTELLSQV